MTTVVVKLEKELSDTYWRGSHSLGGSLRDIRALADMAGAKFSPAVPERQNDEMDHYFYIAGIKAQSGCSADQIARDIITEVSQMSGVAKVSLLPPTSRLVSALKM